MEHSTCASPSSTMSSYSGNVVADVADPNFQVNKCAKFFKTLLNLANDQSQPQKDEIKRIIREILFDNMPPNMFTVRLQAALQSQAQQKLLPFLQKNIAALRRIMMLRDDQISSTLYGEVIMLRHALNAEELLHSNNIIPEDPIVPVSVPNVVQILPPNSSVSLIPRHASTLQTATRQNYQQSNFSARQLHQQKPQQYTQIRIVSTGQPPQNQFEEVDGESIPQYSTVPEHHPMTRIKVEMRDNAIEDESMDTLMTKNGVDDGSQMSTLDASIEGVVRSNRAATLASSGSSNSNLVSLLEHPPAPQSRPISRETPIPPIVQTTAIQQPQPSRLILMNWDEERGNQMLVNPMTLAARIKARMPETDSIDMGMLELISEATEARLRTIVGHLSVMAEHRMEPFRANPGYKQIDDPRRQLRFVEDMEKSAYMKREASEKEALLRLTKSKGKDKDTREKVKEIQRADREATANRDTNAAAFAALGGMRPGAKRGNESLQNGAVGFPGGMGAQVVRSRMKRITMRDLDAVAIMLKDRKLQNRHYI